MNSAKVTVTKKLYLPIILEQGCFVTLTTSCLEIPHKETGGFLIGNQEKRFIEGERVNCFVLNIAYPIQTGKGTIDSWRPGNLAAYDRVINSIRSMNFEIAGEYHSHINSKAVLSDEDIDYLKDEIDDFKKRGVDLRKWLELVIRVNKREFKKPQPTRCKRNELKNKIKCSIRNGSMVGYDLTMAGYWIDLEKLTYKEATLNF